MAPPNRLQYNITDNNRHDKTYLVQILSSSYFYSSSIDVLGEVLLDAVVRADDGAFAVIQSLLEIAVLLCVQYLRDGETVRTHSWV